MKSSAYCSTFTKRSKSKKHQQTDSALYYILQATCFLSAFSEKAFEASFIHPSIAHFLQKKALQRFNNHNRPGATTLSDKTKQAALLTICASQDRCSTLTSCRERKKAQVFTITTDLSNIHSSHLHLCFWLIDNYY